ncbi:MAG TPA: HAD family phosphatase [Solirubrobacterales bacterium]|nr:HAD family phosphatase [Solirubrobacterales bacterium]
MAGKSIFRGVFLDFGGVLTTSVWDSFAAFLRSEGLEPDAIKNLFRHDPGALADLRGLETGELTEGEFETKFGRRLGLKDPEGLIDSMFAGMQPDDAMVAACKEIRSAGMLTGLISNSWSTSHYDRQLLDELFDTAVISAEVHMHKPQPEIYRLAAERLGEKPEDCIFVDDLRENCEGAEAVGMTAVLHRNAAETIARLTELTGVALAAAA